MTNSVQHLLSIATSYEKEFREEHEHFIKSKLDGKLQRLLNDQRCPYIDYTGDNFIDLHPDSYEVNVLLMQSPNVDAWKKKGRKDLSHEQFLYLVSSLANALYDTFVRGRNIEGRVQVTNEPNDACEMKNISLFIYKKIPKKQNLPVAVNTMVLDEGEDHELDGD